MSTIDWPKITESRINSTPDDEISTEQVLLTIEEFKAAVLCGSLVDDDGFGALVFGNELEPGLLISPSQVEDIPETATHIFWFNK